jgi:polygalacturonase
VVDFGAKGDGTTVDTKSINAALAAEQCDEVVLPSGHTFVSGTIVLQSNKVGMHPCTHDTYERASERASE